MGRHSAARRGAQRPSSGRKRALLSLGAVVALGVGSTGAYWTDTATITSSPVTSGKLDVQVGAPNGAAQLTTQGGNWDYASFAVSNLVPGESYAQTVVVLNLSPYSTTALKFNAKVKVSDTNLVSGTDGLTVEVWDGGTAGNSGTEAAGNRVGTCSGTKTYGPSNLTTTDSSNVFSSPTSLDLDTSRNICLKVALPTTAPSALQGKSTKLVLTVSATQPAATNP